MIEKLKALIDDHSEAESKFKSGQVSKDAVVSALGKKLAALEDLAPELIALWSAVQQHENERFDLIEEALNALEGLNAKAAEVLK